MDVNGIVTRKIEIIRDTVRELRRVGNTSTATLENNFFLKCGIERALQICVEAVIDTCHRILSLANQPPCTTASKALDGLEALGALKDASKYKQMVQFRNLVVHRYETVDNTVLVSILQNHLDDFERFIGEILDYDHGSA